MHGVGGAVTVIVTGTEDHTIPKATAVLTLKGAPSGFHSYQRTFDEFLERGKQLRNYRANVIANINN